MHGVLGGRKGVTAQPLLPLCRTTNSHQELFSVWGDPLFYVGLIVWLVHWWKSYIIFLNKELNEFHCYVIVLSLQGPDSELIFWAYRIESGSGLKGFCHSSNWDFHGVGGVSAVLGAHRWEKAKGSYSMFIPGDSWVIVGDAQPLDSRQVSTFQGSNTECRVRTHFARWSNVSSTIT